MGLQGTGIATRIGREGGGGGSEGGNGHRGLDYKAVNECRHRDGSHLRASVTKNPPGRGGIVCRSLLENTHLGGPLRPRIARREASCESGRVGGRGGLDHSGSRGGEIGVRGSTMALAREGSFRCFEEDGIRLSLLADLE